MCTQLTPAQRAAADQLRADATDNLQSLLDTIAQHREYCPDCRPDAGCTSIGVPAASAVAFMDADTTTHVLFAALRLCADLTQQAQVSA